MSASFPSCIDCKQLKYERDGKRNAEGFTCFKCLDKPSGQAGIDKAQKNAEAGSPGWTEKAATRIKDFAQAVGPATQFFIQDVRNDAEANGFEEPPHPRAWGGAAKLANSRGYIIYVDHRAKPHKGEHNSLAAVWRAGNGGR